MLRMANRSIPEETVERIVKQRRDLQAKASAQRLIDEQRARAEYASLCIFVNGYSACMPI